MTETEREERWNNFLERLDEIGEEAAPKAQTHEQIVQDVRAARTKAPPDLAYFEKKVKPDYPGMHNPPKAEPGALDTQVGGEHYKGMKIQPVEFIHANGIGFLEGCIIKRICRWRNKNGFEDLKKIQHECQLLIDLESRKEN